MVAAVRDFMLCPLSRVTSKKNASNISTPFYSICTTKTYQFNLIAEIASAIVQPSMRSLRPVGIVRFYRDLD